MRTSNSIRRLPRADSHLNVRVALPTNPLRPNHPLGPWLTYLWSSHFISGIPNKLRTQWRHLGPYDQLFSTGSNKPYSNFAQLV